MRKRRSEIYDVTYIPEFGTRLLEAIVGKGMTQKELSLRLGLDAGTVNSYVSGRIFPSIPTLKVMCEILDVSADYLLELKDS